MTPEAFADLHRRHDARLRRHAARLLRSGDVDDVLQEVWLRAYRAMPETGNEAAWLHAVTANCCMDALRRPRAVQAEIEPDALPAHDRTDARQDLQEVLGDLARLDERQRTAFVRHVLDGRPHDAIARELQISRQASRSLVLRARRNLQRSRAARALGGLFPSLKVKAAFLSVGVAASALFTVERTEFIEPRTHPQLPEWKLPSGFGVARHDLDVKPGAIGRRLRVRLSCPDGYALWQFDGLRGDARIVVPKRWLGRRAATITVIPQRSGKMTLWAHCRR